jgi:hypothetical protein
MFHLPSPQVMPLAGLKHRSFTFTSECGLVISMQRRFKDIESLRTHQKGPALVAFNEAAAKEDLLAKPLVIKVVKSVSGFYI